MDMPQERLAAFAQLVKDERKRLDLNRSAFCTHIGISRATLRALERGKQQPSQETINKFAKALAMSPELLTGLSRLEVDPLMKDLRPEDLRLANQFHHAGAEAKHVVKAFFSPERSDETRERLALLLDRVMRDEGMLDAIESYLRQLGTPVESISAPAAGSSEDKSSNTDTLKKRGAQGI
jgi:transcriptional regulator with XRE-family HTH domain